MSVHSVIERLNAQRLFDPSSPFHVNIFGLAINKDLQTQLGRDFSAYGAVDLRPLAVR